MAKQRSENPKSNPGLEAYDVKVKSQTDRLLLAVKRIQIQKGACIVVMGANGAGKSTLLKVLSGHIAAPGSRIIFQNSRMQPAETRLIPGFPGMYLMAQHSDLDPNLLVSDQIDRVLRSYRESDRKRLKNHLIEKLHLKALLDKKIQSLSAGERRRLGFVEIENSRPELIFLDEPFSDLDPGMREQFLDSLFDLKEEGASLVLVSHNPEDALLLADQVWVMANGKMVEIIPKEKEEFRPQTLEGARVFGLKNIVPIAKWKGMGLAAIFPERKVLAYHIPPETVLDSGELCLGVFRQQVKWRDHDKWVSRWKKENSDLVLICISQQKPSKDRQELFTNRECIRTLG